MTSLYVSVNRLTSLDVSNNTALTSLHASNNKLTSLDVSNNTALTEFYAVDGQLTSLNVSGATALTDLNVSNNKLTSLDLSNNTALTVLNVLGNQLTSLDVSNNTALSYLFTDNILVKANIESEELTQGTKLDLSGLGFLGSNQSINNTDNYTYDSENKIVTINNLSETGGYIQVTSSRTYYNYKLQIPGFHFLTLDINGGKGKLEPVSCYPESGSTECPVTIPSDLPTRNDGFFLGWSDDKDSNNVTHQPGDTITLNNSKTLYAVWAVITNNTKEAIINTIPSENSFTVTSNKACKALWTGDDGTTWNNLNPNPVAGNDDMRKFNINNSQLGNTEIVVFYIGDANSDKALNARDARKIVNAIMDKDSLSSLEGILADVNNDGSVNIRDARIILNNIMGKANIAW